MRRELRERRIDGSGWGKILAIILLLVGVCLGGQSRAAGAELRPENLPADTYLYLAVSRVDETLKAFETTPWGRLIRSEEFKPFWEESVGKFQRKITQPLQKELRLEFRDYAGIFEGPLLVALIPSTNQNVLLNDSCVIIAEAGSKGEERLAKNLETLREKWKAAGVDVPQVDVRGVEFTRFTLSAEMIKRFTEQMGAPEGSFFAGVSAAGRNLEVWIGLDGRKMIAALGDLSAAEKVILAEAGKVERLKSLPSYVEGEAIFKGALGHLWMQPPPMVRALYQVLAQAMDTLESQTAAEGKKLNPFFPNLALLLRSLHLESVSSAAVATDVSPAGLRTRFHIASPVSKRAGLTQLLNAAKMEECRAPDLVPVQAISCGRLRVDISKAWGILNEITNDAYPLKELLFLGFEQGYKREVPEVNLEENVLKCFGDDVIFYEMASAEKPGQVDWVYLIGAPEPRVLLETLVELYSHTKKAVGFAEPYTFKKNEEGGVLLYTGEPVEGVALPRLYLIAHAGYVGYSTSEAAVRALSQYKEEPRGKAKKTEAPLVFFREENSLEEMRLYWNQITGKETSERSVSRLVLPFPLSRLNYSVLPPFEECSEYLCPASLFSLSVSPQGLDGTLLTVFP